MTTRRTRTPVQTTLLGKPAPIPQPRKPSRPDINDPELVASVIRTAINRGYVLIGPAQRVYLREPGQTRKGARVEPVPSYEQDTVHQLLDTRHLTTGGTHIVRAAGREGPATSVLVPKASQAMVSRWAALAPLNGRKRTGSGGP